MIYILCATVLIAGLVLAVYIKREGEKSYARHQEMVRRRQQREQMARVTKAFTQFRITLVDEFTPAIQKTNAALQRMAETLAEKGVR